MLRQIRFQNILSFGPDPEVLDLQALNVVIGPNGAGKSNLIEVIDLLRSAPRELAVPVQEGGGVRDWLWKGGDGVATACVEAVIDYPQGRHALRHLLAFTEAGQRFQVTDERVEDAAADANNGGTSVYFRYGTGRPMLMDALTRRRTAVMHVHPQRSILAQRRDPEHYPEITWLAEYYEGVRLYRDWAFGRHVAPRLPQKADLPNDFLREDATNLTLVLNAFRRLGAHKRALLAEIQRLYANIDDFDVIVEGGTVQLFLSESDRVIPATRLSDGTLRYLALLSVLCHPTPPGLVCIEEPELGLHPDILPRLAELIREASTRTQLIVTTHSEVLVDALTEVPDAVVIAEKRAGSTRFSRLDAEHLRTWLKDYTLGDLWTRGELGGTRW
ncbi:MAG: AAA family ATPase [Myxococcales bacterium]|nr:AAA family ATPase [Myxococcales bacterium]